MCVYALAGTARCVLTCAVSPQLVCLPATTEHDSLHRPPHTCLWPESNAGAQQGPSLCRLGVCPCVCGKVIRSEGEQVAAAYFSLVHPSSSSCAQPPLLQWQRSKVGPGKGFWLGARDIPAFLCSLNWSQRGLSPEINGLRCYLNTR